METKRNLPKPDAELEALVTAVIGAAVEVHTILGPGHMESTYERALCRELKMRGIAYKKQHKLDVDYKGERVGESRADLLVAGRLIVEMKAVESLAPVHHAQVRSYIRIQSEILGLLLNFNVPAMNSKNAIRRVIIGEVAAE